MLNLLNLKQPEVSISAAGAQAGQVITAVNDGSTLIAQWGSSVNTHAACVAATTVNLTIANPGTATFDGIVLTAGQRLLVKNQSTASQNGIYVFATSSTPLTRATDMDSGSEAQSGAQVYVNSGTVNGGKSFTLIGQDPIVIGTSAINFSMNGSGSLTSAHIFVGNGSNIATDVAVSGDLSLVNTGAFTIANSAVTLAKMANIATLTLLGNSTGLSAAPQALSASSARTVLGLATGDAVTFASVSATTFTGALSGNATTATTLATARAINGVNFDGSAAITVTAAAGTLTGVTLASNVLASSLTSVGTLAALTVTATITGSVSGNAATATALQTGRAINGVTFDGTAAITVTAAGSTLTGSSLASGITSSSLTSLGTQAANLLFTDATYDIGASGANRPRSMFLSSSATLGGTIGIGTTAVTNIGVRVNSTTLIGTSPSGVESTSTFQSGATNQGNAIYAQLATQATSFTMTTGRGVRIASPSIGAGSTVTTVVGLEVNDQTGGGSNFAIRTGSGIVSLGDTTDATSASAASLTAAGGMGIAKKLWMGAQIVPFTQTFSNVGASVTANVQYVGQTGTMSASRALTLPAASTYPRGSVIVIADESGTVTVSNTIVITRAGSDTIDGATTFTINFAYGAATLASDGTSKWTVINKVLA